MILFSSDITGAIDYNATPYLPFEMPLPLSISSRLPEQSRQFIEKDVTQLLNSCEVHPDLIDVMVTVAYFVQVLQSQPKVTSDHAGFSEDMYWIEFRLLAFPTSLPDGFPERTIDTACRLGALIYMKTVLEEFPHSKTGSTILLRELREALQTLPIVESTAPLVLWLSLVGSAVAKAPEKNWFVSHLGKLTAVSGASSFNDMELDMSRTFNLRSILGKSLDRLRESVTVAMG